MTPTARAQYNAYEIVHETMQHKSTGYADTHAPKVAKAILAGAQGLSGRCIILNARNHDGLPLSQLSKQFTLTLASSHTDFSCIFNTLSEQLETLSRKPLKDFLRETPHIIDKLTFPDPAERFPSPSYQYVVSHRVTGLWGEMISHYLVNATIAKAYRTKADIKNIDYAVDDLVERMQTYHLETLRHLVSPDGRVFFCDIAKILYQFPHREHLVEHRELRPPFETAQDELFKPGASEEWTYTHTPLRESTLSNGQTAYQIGMHHEITARVLEPLAK